MGGLTGYLFPQPIRDSVFSTERGLEYLSKGHNSTRDKKRRSMVDPPLLPDVLRERELASRLNLSFIGRHSWADMRQFVSMVTKQTLIEKRVEAALVQDGFRPENILSQRYEGDPIL
ncbi:hypothetical protein Salat_2989300 [Sesamum alatum]|uniref:Uncharacterized protein n=1 Tax=Sesamum alatum TaxID=300844 RepID=A0AAE1XHF8_9LAMI|nr:hypothetical protein Salat_2996100 [Sesamum alatum]KAK4412271.1 hypothetical protein Salat_2989300 [Sesamum alatum]